MARAGALLEATRWPESRCWTIRLLGDDHRMNSELQRELVGLALRPSSTLRFVASSRRSCQRLQGAADAAAGILDRLARSGVEDAADTHIPNLIWWAFERQLRNDKEAVVSLLCTQDAQNGVLFRTVIERTARVLASDGESG